MDVVSVLFSCVPNSFPSRQGKTATRDQRALSTWMFVNVRHTPGSDGTNPALYVTNDGSAIVFPGLDGSSNVYTLTKAFGPGERNRDVYSRELGLDIRLMAEEKCQTTKLVVPLITVDLASLFDVMFGDLKTPETWGVLACTLSEVLRASSRAGHAVRLCALVSDTHASYDLLDPSFSVIELSGAMGFETSLRKTIESSGESIKAIAEVRKRIIEFSSRPMIASLSFSFMVSFGKCEVILFFPPPVTQEPSLIPVVSSLIDIWRNDATASNSTMHKLVARVPVGLLQIMNMTRTQSKLVFVVTLFDDVLLDQAELIISDISTRLRKTDGTKHTGDVVQPGSTNRKEVEMLGTLRGHWLKKLLETKETETRLQESLITKQGMLETMREEHEAMNAKIQRTQNEISSLSRVAAQRNNRESIAMADRTEVERVKAECARKMEELRDAHRALDAEMRRSVDAKVVERTIKEGRDVMSAVVQSRMTKAACEVELALQLTEKLKRLEVEEQELHGELEDTIITKAQLEAECARCSRLL